MTLSLLLAFLLGALSGCMTGISAALYVGYRRYQDALLEGGAVANIDITELAQEILRLEREQMLLN